LAWALCKVRHLIPTRQAQLHGAKAVMAEIYGRADGKLA